ncbi:hypothetical protein G7067_10800 [Leucobacter insecticola]|uniref:Recombinase A n=1 Tax=Leucobacter insecticola TaxID=2714934 RepID=A0A6G8FKG8_9MICO|nr:hypothetical protein [Leucobacter insecticola]QIM16783.1 hypothetical protein G7067_10800 [Leucobacter insecticola]
MASVATVHTLQQRITEMQPLRLDDRALPTHPGLRQLFPGGALKKGASYAVQGSQQLALSMLSAASASGEWCGVIGCPTFSAEAATSLGIALERLILIPAPGADALALSGTLSEILTVVLLMLPTRPSHRDVERISARLREHGTALIVAGDWPHPESSLRVTASRWRGLGTGYGLLEEREISVRTQDRRGISEHTVRFTGGRIQGPAGATAAQPRLPRAVPQ